MRIIEDSSKKEVGYVFPKPLQLMTPEVKFGTKGSRWNITNTIKKLYLDVVLLNRVYKF